MVDIKLELGDSDYQATLGQVKLSLISPVILQNPAAGTIFYISISTWCLELLETLLPAPTTLIGIDALFLSLNLKDKIRLCSHDRIQSEEGLPQSFMVYKLALILGGFRISRV